MQKYWQTFLGWVTARPAGMTDDMARLIFVARVGYPVGLILHSLMLACFLHLKIYPLILFNIASLIMWIVAIWRLNWYGEIRWSFVVCVLIEVPVHSIVATWFVGIEPGFIFYVIASIVLTPLAAFLSRGTRIVTCLALVVALLVSGVVAQSSVPWVPLSSAWNTLLFAINVGSLAFMIGVFVLMYEWIATSAETNLQSSRARTEQANVSLENVSRQLAKYISPQLYQAIKSGSQEVSVASKRKKLTIFFSDIVGFTETTDQLESEELTNLLNEYLTEMSVIAQQHGANFDKFIGDAIVLYFGDPETAGVKEDAAQCVRMAIAMQQRMHELRSRWREQGLERPFELRIGINTGYCTVGNFGSEDRMDYTIIGGEVNLAARLESHAETGGILLAHETYAQVRDWLMAEEGEQITVKGFAKPVTTYRVLGIYDDLASEGRITRHDAEGVTVTIDQEKLADRSGAVDALKAAIAEIEGG
jgi:class 3 adenylate cyclase